MSARGLTTPHPDFAYLVCIIRKKERPLDNNSP